MLATLYTYNSIQGSLIMLVAKEGIAEFKILFLPKKPIDLIDGMDRKTNIQGGMVTRVMTKPKEKEIDKSR